ncbi:oxidoreductase [Xylariaceae sp. FL0662B]|nr:oxidoreductase [Xylariaceae sp. FL0662B]
MAETISTTPLNVGIIGYGLSATIFHIPFITTTSSLRLHSILQRNPDASPSAPRDHPDLKHFTALDPFLADPSLHVVVVTTPPQTHFALARAALEAGKHMFVEKPFVPSVAEAEALIRLAREAGRRICVYQNRRWDSDFLTVRKLLADGALGRVVEFETHFDRFRPGAPATNWKGTLPMSQGGTVLFDLGTHLLDQVYVLFGLPSSVYAKYAVQRTGVLLGPQNWKDETSDPDPEPDSATLHLFYGGTGTTAVVRMGVVSAEAKQPRFWVRGAGGSYRKRGLDTQEPQLRAGMRTSDAAFGLEGPEWSGTLTTVEDGDGGAMREQPYPNVAPPQTYRRIYELFGAALQGREPDVPVPAEQARDVLRIIEAAKESARTGREVALSSSSS